MTLPLIVWLCVQVVTLMAYAALVSNGHGWWAVPVLVVGVLRRRPTEKAAA